MSEEYDVSEFRQKDLIDYLDAAVKGLYTLGALMFLGGLWIDWQSPGQVVFSFLVFTDDPHANSGLFIMAIIVMAVGFLVSRTADFIEERRYDEAEEQTQEWVVDVRADR